LPIPPVSQDGLTSDVCLLSGRRVFASKRFTDAWSNQAKSPEVVAGLYAAVERMRLISSSSVVRAAEQVIRNVVEAYSDPNKTFDETRKRIESGELRNPLREFTEARKEELRAMRG